MSFLASIIPPVLVMAGLSANTSLIVGFAVLAVGALPMAYGGVVLTRKLLAEPDQKTRIARYLIGRMILHGGQLTCHHNTARHGQSSLNTTTPRQL